MSYQPFTELPKKSTQQNARRRPSTTPACFVQGESRSPILQLQRTLGNRRVAELIQTKRLTPEGRIIGLQRKLTVGAADDQYEQEADRVARQVVSMPDSVAMASLQQAPPIEVEASQTHTLQSKPLALAASITPFVQRQMAGEEEIEDKNKEEDKDKLLQAKVFNKSAALPLQRQLASEEEKTEPVQAKLSIHRDIAPAEEDKDQVLQTKQLATSSPPVVQRQTQSDEESEDWTAAIQAKFLTETYSSPMQRQSAAEEEEPETIQTKSAGSLSDSFEAGDDVESRLRQSKGSGSQLPDAVRTYMEPRFGLDFSHVNVHTGSNAAQMNQAIGAQAFTHGSDIYFGAGSSPNNLELTAHELTHVVQQTSGAQLKAKHLDTILSANYMSIKRICTACGADVNEGKTAKPLSSQWMRGARLQQAADTGNAGTTGLLQRTVTNLAVAGAVAEAGHANHFVAPRGAGPIIVTATVSAPGQAVSWTGGRRQRGNDLERVIPSAPGTVAVTADTPADPGPQSATIHVVNGRTAPANVPAQLNFSRQAGNPPGFPAAGLFGLTDVTTNNPTVRIRAFVTGNQWVFQVERIRHRFQLGVANGNINIRTAASATPANHCRVITDLTPPAAGAGAGPPRATFWSRPITEAHEFAHVARFYSPPFWEAFMRIAETTIEAAGSNVNIDHTVPATMANSAAVVTTNGAVHQAIIDAQHAAADAAEIVGAEVAAHDQSNPMYATLVAQITARFRPLAPTALAAVALGPASVRLTWTHNACNDTEYRVYRRGPRGGFNQIATLPAGSVTFTDTTPGMVAATNFTYHVTAVGVAGESNRSNRVAITTP